MGSPARRSARLQSGRAARSWGLPTPATAEISPSAGESSLHPDTGLLDLSGDSLDIGYDSLDVSRDSLDMSHDSLDLGRDSLDVSHDFLDLSGDSVDLSGASPGLGGSPAGLDGLDGASAGAHDDSEHPPEDSDALDIGEDRGDAHWLDATRSPLSCAAPGTFVGCYLLRSTRANYAGRTYVGFTVNPPRRLRQHNGQLGGGAWQTDRGRPWEMVALVYGFPSRLAALQFEWAWQNPHRSRHLTGASEDALPAALPRAPKPGKRPAAGGVTGRLRALAGLLARPAWRCLPLRVHGLPALGDRERRLLGQLMARARELAGKSAAWAPEPAFGPIDQLPFRFPTTGSGEAWNPPAMAPDPEEPRCSVCWRDLRDVPPLAPHRAPPGPGAEVARQLGLDAALLLDEAGVPGPAAGGRPPACAFGPDGRFFVECPTCRAPAHPRCGALFLLGPAAGATPGEGLLLPTAGRCWSTARVTHDPGTPGCLAILAWSECVAAMRTRVKLPPAPSQPGD